VEALFSNSVLCLLSYFMRCILEAPSKGIVHTCGGEKCRQLRRMEGQNNTDGLGVRGFVQIKGSTMIFFGCDPFMKSYK
jgi:hypothetical protein